MLKLRLKWFLLIIAISSLIISCSGPSSNEIENAVKSSLESALPIQYALDVVVEEVDIIKIGSSQDKGAYRYWPVKVFVSGEYLPGYFSKKRKAFEGKTIFNLTQDGFGEWKASYAGRWNDLL